MWVGFWSITWDFLVWNDGSFGTSGIEFFYKFWIVEWVEYWCGHWNGFIRSLEAKFGLDYVLIIRVAVVDFGNDYSRLVLLEGVDVLGFNCEWFEESCSDLIVR